MSEDKTPENISERIAVVENQQAYHKETLNEISNTLKEVVKTQHTLANQNKDLKKLNDSVDCLIENYHSLEKKYEILNHRLETAENNFNDLKKVERDKDSEKRVSRNKLIVGIVVTVLGIAITGYFSL